MLKPNTIFRGDCLEVMRQWPDECVDMCVTSPPYWNLRDYGVEGQLGLEKTPEEFIKKMVAVFLEVRRVLRPWGTLWLNIGDNYASGKGSCHNPGGGEASLGKKRKADGAHPLHRGNVSDLRLSGLKAKDLCMMPARVALALQAEGWWLRSDIIWSKPSQMPESVTDRPTSAYEHIFLLAKSVKYFYDIDGVRVPHKEVSINRMRYGWKGNLCKGHKMSGIANAEKMETCHPSGANLRNVWTMSSQSYQGAHFATFPEELPRRCILAGTSHKGNCAGCGMPWERIVKPSEEYAKALGGGWAEKTKEPLVHGSTFTKQPLTRDYRTVGWQPSCNCNADIVPPIVLDPFFGSGTVGKVATDLGRNWVGIELNEEYIKNQARLRAGGSTSEEIVKDRPLFGEAMA